MIVPEESGKQGMGTAVCRLHADKNGVVGRGVKFERIRRITGLSGGYVRAL